MATVVERTVVGIPAYVLQVVDQTARRGDLAWLRPPHPLGESGEIAVRIGVYAAPEPRTPLSKADTPRYWRPTLVGAAVTGVSAGLGGLAYLGWHVWRWLVDHWPALLGAVLVVLVLLAVLARLSGSDRGRHCPGC